jgi:cyanophycin synthetase
MRKRSRWPTRWNSPTLGLQAQAGCPVTFSRTAQTLEKGTYQVVVEYSEEAVGRLAFELAQELCRAAVEDQPFELAAALRRLRELDEEVRLGPSTGSDRLCRGGAQHPLPPADRRQHGAVWLGQQTAPHSGGRNRPHQRRRRIHRAGQGTDQDLLHAAGVPVPSGRPVLSADDAWAAACEIGGYRSSSSRRMAIRARASPSI